MNRIRKIDKTYQVLITPTQVSNAGFELIRGDLLSFDDSFLRNYSVVTYDTLGEAQCEAFNYPDIDWDSMVLLNKNAYIDIRNLIRQDLIKTKTIGRVEFDAYMMDSIKLKNAMFDRVLNSGSRFNLSYQLNDIISYKIVALWTKTLDEVASHLINDTRLRIKKIKKVNGMTVLIGLTDVSTAYEIRLIPSILNQYVNWTEDNNITNEKLKREMLIKCLKQQRKLDGDFVIS
ncbi:MAG: hypothetical protein Terrestrivirus2_184 [Terrestrivirus sp.]|jgi:hypothetical protein|uniref:Uncharacterized protein n=1 Tax=Terrestrivirus sp. TaxID=2487775 RepID=A0A3G4ZLG8_9VIRU|nr:MAG: hypothetical protein Terrestrivirus2_184 [Terrestrivirus sp.]